MIVQVIEEFLVPVDESECHAPTPIHPDRPMIGDPAEQPMHAKSRNVDVLRSLGDIQSQEDATEFGRMDCLHFACRFPPISAKASPRGSR
jgi:hypothetical protein